MEALEKRASRAVNGEKVGCQVVVQARSVVVDWSVACSPDTRVLGVSTYLFEGEVPEKHLPGAIGLGEMYFEAFYIRSSHPVPGQPRRVPR